MARRRDVQGLRARRRLRVPASTQIAAHDYGARGVTLARRRDLRQRRRQERQRRISRRSSRTDCVVALTDPVYPVYADTNVMAGRSGPADASGRYAGLRLPAVHRRERLPARAARPARGPHLPLLPEQPDRRGDDARRARRWVDYARAHEAVILYDAAYEAYIRDPEVPRSIYEIEGAREVAIEFAELLEDGRLHRHALRLHRGAARRRTAATADGRRGRACTRSGSGARRPSPTASPYIDPAGGRGGVHAGGPQAGARADRLLHGERAHHPRRAGARPGSPCTAARNAPYIWLKTPAGLTSWDFFDRLLDEAHVVGTPGSGFGPSGEGYFRLTALRLPRADARRRSSASARASRCEDQTADLPRRNPTMIKRIAAVLAALALTASLAEAQEVKVGVALPFTGVGAEFAQLVDRGMELYLKLNADEVKPLQDHADQARREGPGRRQREDRGPGAADPGQRRRARRLDLLAERDRLGADRDRGQEARGDHERGHRAHHQPVAVLRPHLVQHVARGLCAGRGGGQDPQRQDRGGRLHRLPARQGQPRRVQAGVRGRTAAR